MQARFRVTAKHGNTVYLEPVTVSKSKENQAFFGDHPEFPEDAVPPISRGQISLHEVAPEVAAMFEEGKDYVVDVKPAK
jgi:hypothetical protein